MTFPHFPDKIGDRRTLFAAKQEATPRRWGRPVDPPESMIFLYDTDLFQAIKRRWRGVSIRGFYGQVALLRRTGDQIGICGGFGIGGPVTAVQLERLSAWGVNRFLILGIAGGLQPYLKPGEIILPTGAIRDEGTSYHYLAAGRPALPAQALLQAVEDRLHQASISFLTGLTWTTDAPFRETLAEAEQLMADGVLTVEMEIATLYAVAGYLKVDAAALLAVGDRMQKDAWSLNFDRDYVNNRLIDVANTLIRGWAA